MKYISKIAVACLMTGIISVSCDDKQIDRIVLEVPEPPEKSLGVNDYNDLKSYIDRNASPQFILGTGVLQADLLQKETMYLLTNLNFDEITVKDIMFHSSIVNDEGAMDFGNVQTVVETAHQAGLSVFGHALVTHNELNTAYLKALIANTTEEIIIPPPSDVEWQEGTTVLFDFELNSIGDTNPMSNANGVATVVNDPKGESGKVLHINGNTGTVDPVIGGGANQSFPEFSVTLPEGRKLGDYVSLTLDMHINNSRGIFGQGMMLHINGKEATYGNVASFGNP
ncbi:MAG: endo-1,4-beta-xylanase, partial [Tannerella sp.]|nr:endo-1,4-beta-xylanase [Tannerella sp.]